MGRIPQAAKAEIDEILAASMEIYADDLVDILTRYGVQEKPEILQRRYRQQVAQRYMSSYRDAAGNRAVVSVRDQNCRQKYSVVDACNDLRGLRAVRHSLDAHAAGVRKTEKLVRHRILVLERLLRPFQNKAGKKYTASQHHRVKKDCGDSA